MKQSTFKTGRICAISDGVFSIAMTLLVLGLKLPDPGPDIASDNFNSLILDQAPLILSWFLSFAILCRLWITQHAFLAEGETRSRRFIGWNFVFLGAVSFIPFPASLIAEYNDEILSVFIFSGTLAISGTSLCGMWRAEKRRLLTSGTKVSESNMPSKNVVVLLFVTALIACGVAFFKPQLGVLIWCFYPIFSFYLHK